LNVYFWQGWVPKSSGTGLNRELHLFSDSFAPLSHPTGTNSLKSWLYRNQGTMRPHAWASWLKWPNYAAPVELAKGGRVGGRVPCVTLINYHLSRDCAASLQSHGASELKYQCIYRRPKSAFGCNPIPRWLQLLAQGPLATISGHPTFVAPGRQRTTIQIWRGKRRRPRPATSITKMTKAVISSCVKDSASVAQCWNIDRKDRL